MCKEKQRSSFPIVAKTSLTLWAKEKALVPIKCSVNIEGVYGAEGVAFVIV